ncbi:hypothetical protein AB1Y20_012012 [Prymnesium parvum]|uniref:Kinesin light chain n=1 Tax=Prymnesium parvum TaxID=97485 RepID=A0AB34IMZ2_PRYPA
MALRRLLPPPPNLPRVPFPHLPRPALPRRLPPAPAPALLPFSRRCTTLSGAHSPPEPPRRLHSLHAEVAALHRAARYAEARERATEAYHLARRHFGASHPAFASAANNLALMHKRLGEAEAAARLYAEALGAYRAALGDEHLSTATAACNLALLRRDGGEAEGAERLLEAALRTRQKLLGEAHEEVASTRQMLASVVARDPARWESAAALLEQSRRGLEAEGEPEDEARALRLATTLNSLGLLRKRQRRHAEARELYERALRLRELHAGECHPESIACLHNLAELIRAEGDEAEAVALQHEILRRIESLAAGPAR